MIKNTKWARQAQTTLEGKKKREKDETNPSRC